MVELVLVKLKSDAKNKESELDSPLSQAKKSLEDLRTGRVREI